MWRGVNWACTGKIARAARRAKRVGTLGVMVGWDQVIGLGKWFSQLSGCHNGAVSDIV
jgi:hypothetical protein